MGNSVADFAKDAPAGHRDRQSTRLHAQTTASLYMTGSKPDMTPYASGAAQRCVDQEIPGFHSIMRLRKKHRGVRNLDLGHSFALERVQLSMPTTINTKQHIAGAYYQNYTGLYAPTVSYKAMMGQAARGAFPDLPATLGTDRLGLFSLGATAIAKSIPDVPSFSLFRFVGELKAGLPKVPLAVLAKERKLRNVGGEYLNYQFGIAPTISDLQKFLELLQNPKLRSQVKHQLDKEFRVRKTIDKGTTVTKRDLSYSELVTLPATYSSTPVGTETKYQSYRIWSSCSFAYHQVSMLDQLLDELDAKMGGMGAIPTAIDIWNLVPWSWLVDWFTNFNHVITNLSYLGKDGLYLRHGYIMGHFDDRVVSEQRSVFMGQSLRTEGTLLTERKYRVKASPFGFGLTWKDFDPFQLSILGALGVSRLRF